MAIPFRSLGETAPQLPISRLEHPHHGCVGPAAKDSSPFAVPSLRCDLVRHSRRKLFVQSIYLECGVRRPAARIDVQWNPDRSTHQSGMDGTSIGKGPRPVHEGRSGQAWIDTSRIPHSERAVGGGRMLDACNVFKFELLTECRSQRVLRRIGIGRDLNRHHGQSGRRNQAYYQKGQSRKQQTPKDCLSHHPDSIYPRGKLIPPGHHSGAPVPRQPDPGSRRSSGSSSFLRQGDALFS